MQYITNMFSTFKEYFENSTNPNIEEVKFMIEHGVSDYYDGFNYAKKGKHLKIANFLRMKLENMVYGMS